MPSCPSRPGSPRSSVSCRATHGRRARDSEIRGDGQVLGALDEIPKPVVVPLLRAGCSRHGHDHRPFPTLRSTHRGRLGAAAGVMTTRAGKCRMSVGTARQDPYVERLIGSVRRECLDHVIVLNDAHLRRTLARYISYYHDSGTHLSLAKDAPTSRRVQPVTEGDVIAFREVGGLHHRYERRAA
jgi:Integrase core domain